jgi:hypothetical protein
MLIACSPPEPEVRGTPPKNGVAQSEQTKAPAPASTSKTPATCRNACRKKYADVAPIRDEYDTCMKVCDAGDTDCTDSCDTDRAIDCNGSDECDAIDACFDACG